MHTTHFRPLNPRTWPSLYKLSALIPLIPIIHYYCLPPLLFDFLRHSSKLRSHFNITLSLSFILLSIIVIKIKSILNERYEAFKIFDKGKVPSVPNKHPLSGNLFEIIVPENNVHIIEKYHAKLGKTFGMFYGPDPWIFTTELDLLYKLFVTDGNKYIDISQYRLPFITEVNESLAQLQGEKWRRTRRTLNPFFAHRQMRSDNVFGDINKVGEKLLDCIFNHPIVGRDESTGDKAGCRIVDVLYTFKKYAVQVILQFAFGLEYGINMEPEARDELLDIIHAGSRQIRGPIVWTSIMFESAQHLFGYFARFTPINKYISYIHSMLNNSLEHRRQFRKREKINKWNRKMIDTMIECIDSKKMDEETLKANLFFIFIAGFETSANTLTFLFWWLAREQRVQEKLREAITVEGEQAQYLEWCLQEILRLYPAVPTAIGRILHENIELNNGQTLFKGTTVCASIYSIHHCKEYWGEDVEDFRPERFGELTLHPAQYFAFGLGPRNCIGMNLAMAQLRIIVPRILLKYRVEFCSTTPQHIPVISPNLLHMIIEGRIDLKFIELSSL